MAPPLAPGTLLYHYLPARHAIDDIQNRRLRISKIEDFNDVFEDQIGYLDGEDGHGAMVMNQALKNYWMEHRIICFSKESGQNLMWAHYAEKHKGIALGFVLDRPGRAESLDYTADRLCISPIDTIPISQLNEVVETLFKRNKQDAWEYEKEVRSIIPINKWFSAQETNGNLYHDFVHIGASCAESFLVLKEVVLGCRYGLDPKDNAISPEGVRAVLREQGFQDVRLCQARPHRNKYQIIVEPI